MSRNGQRQVNEGLSPPPRPLSLVQESPQEQINRRPHNGGAIAAIEGVEIIHNDVMHRVISIHTTNILTREASKDVTAKIIELQGKVGVLLRRLGRLERQAPTIPPQQGDEYNVHAGGEGGVP